MTATESVRQSGNGNAPEQSGDTPDLARARDGHRTQPGDILPEAESVREWFSDVRDWFAERRGLIWSGEIWDIQPPSPRELVDRARDSDWWESDAGIMRFLARAGLVFNLAWSVPWYTVAVLGQRSGRRFTALLVAGLIWYLI